MSAPLVPAQFNTVKLSVTSAVEGTDISGRLMIVSKYPSSVRFREVS